MLRKVLFWTELILLLIVWGKDNKRKCTHFNFCERTLVFSIASSLLSLTFYRSVALHKDKSPHSGAKDTELILNLHVLEGNIRACFHRCNSPTQTFQCTFFGEQCLLKERLSLTNSNTNTPENKLSTNSKPVNYSLIYVMPSIQIILGIRRLNSFHKSPVRFKISLHE